MTSNDNASLFSGRVENYIKYRPTYPPALMDLLAEKCALTPASVIADIGSGTGILTELFLQHGNPVYAVEPNAEMRAAAEKLLGRYPNFHSVDAAAESSGLRPRSVDFITAGQAFHWFKIEAARAEFIRILKPRGWVALIWNLPRVETPFEKDYNEIWQNDLKSSHEARDQYETLVAEFFGAAQPQRVRLEGMAQVMDGGQLAGRVLSSSAAPRAGGAGYESFLQKIHGVFERRQQNGRVILRYNTEIFFGNLV